MNLLLFVFQLFVLFFCSFSKLVEINEYTNTDQRNDNENQCICVVSP